MSKSPIRKEEKMENEMNYIFFRKSIKIRHVMLINAMTLQFIHVLMNIIFHI